MMNRPAPAIVFVLGLAAVSAAGCTSGTTANSAASTAGGSASSSAPAPAASTAPAGAVDVCSLMTASQASTIVGVTYSAANGSSATCTYPTTAAPVPMSIFVSAASDADWTAELATIQEGTGEIPATFSGVGDHAAGGGTEFGVESGKWIIDILGGDPLGNGTTFPKSTALAQALIRQLP
jgi:hypothetical protein